MAELALAVRALQAGREPSEIAHHGAACCGLARAWLQCLDSSFHRGRARDAPPAWIAGRWSSAATSTPLHWCEIPGARGLDCGASAALGRALWGWRCEGIRAVQLVEHHVTDRAATCNRDELRAGSTDAGDLAYHEAIGREQGGRLEVWDSSDCAWLRPPPSSSRGQTLSLRVAGPQPTIMRWGEHHLSAGVWTALGAHRSDA